MNKIKFVCLESCNFIDYPPGGTLSFACQLRKVFGSQIALVGIVTDDTICGRWIIKKIEGVEYNFFGLGRVDANASRPLVPNRLLTYFYLYQHISKLAKFPVKKVFTQTPQFMFLLNKSDWNSICFLFAGTANSVAISRYFYLRWLGSIYEKRLFKALAYNADCILAASDKNAILSTIKRSKGVLNSNKIIQFPTRFDDKVFYPKDKMMCRMKLNLSLNETIIVVVGRIASVKGWQFAVDTFQNYLLDDPTAKLIFVGDGEDRYQLETLYKFNVFEKKNILITGHISPQKVSIYLGAASVMMVSSFEEGWSTAMVEALACGKSIVTTTVSGASEMIFHNENGVILKDRDPVKASEALLRVSKFKDPNPKSLELSSRFRLDLLSQDLEQFWMI